MCLVGACVPLVPCAGDDCAHGPAFAIPDTNLRVCYGASPNGSDGTIACPGTPGTESCATTDYCGGDAQYGWDLAHPSTERFMVVASDEPVVVDAITSRQWQGCVLGQSGASCAGEGMRVDWFTAEAYCDDASWGDHDDWVLPSSFELQSISDYGTTSPAIDVLVFVNAPTRHQGVAQPGRRAQPLTGDRHCVLSRHAVLRHRHDPAQRRSILVVDRTFVQQLCAVRRLRLRLLALLRAARGPSCTLRARSVRLFRGGAALLDRVSTRATLQAYGSS